MPVTVESAKKYQEQEAQKTSETINAGSGISLGGENKPAEKNNKKALIKKIGIAVLIAGGLYLAYRYFIKNKGKVSDNNGSSFQPQNVE